MSNKKKNQKILYVSMNLGCSGFCELCPTRGLLGCSKITVESLIDWDAFEKVIEKSEAETVILIGGENPFIYSNGHRNIYYHLQDKVKKYKKKLYVICGYEGSTNTDILPFFDKMLLYIPKEWKEFDLKVLNTLYIKSYVDIQTFIETEKVTKDWLSTVKKEFFVNPTLYLTTNEERQKIPEYMAKHGDFGFVGELIKRKYPVYSLTENKLYKRLRTGYEPWRKLIGLG